MMDRDYEGDQYEQWEAWENEQEHLASEAAEAEADANAAEREMATNSLSAHKEACPGTSRS